ncbi:hypothetical protein RF55_23935 [Lasius niger]|uniref:Uncharacterized protein n=1 Tax=Lasius niger TaxID=67767 RepID=A0A0J7MNJ7_LASNI|nr:hypothetical protein RF55_23935 [Lasius niger]
MKQLIEENLKPILQTIQQIQINQNIILTKLIESKIMQEQEIIYISEENIQSRHKENVNNGKNSSYINDEAANQVTNQATKTKNDQQSIIDSGKTNEVRNDFLKNLKYDNIKNQQLKRNLVENDVINKKKSGESGLRASGSGATLPLGGMDTSS